MNGGVKFQTKTNKNKKSIYRDLKKITKKFKNSSEKLKQSSQKLKQTSKKQTKKNPINKERIKEYNKKLLDKLRKTKKFKKITSLRNTKPKSLTEQEKILKEAEELLGDGDIKTEDDILEDEAFRYGEQENKVLEIKNKLDILLPKKIEYEKISKKLNKDIDKLNTLIKREEKSISNNIINQEFKRLKNTRSSTIQEKQKQRFSKANDSQKTIIESNKKINLLNEEKEKLEKTLNDLNQKYNQFNSEYNTLNDELDKMKSEFIVYNP